MINQELIIDLRRGERIRVIFDLLMETIEAEQGIKQGEVFVKIKELIEKEERARAIFYQQAGPAPVEKKTRRKRGVGVQSELDTEPKEQAGPLFGVEHPDNEGLPPDMAEANDHFKGRL